MKKSEMVNILIRGGIDKNEAKAEVDLILEFKLNKAREEILFIEDFDKSVFEPVLKERVETKRPIQYILGLAPFMGEKFIVNNSVLIPRDDTEILVVESFKKVKKNSKILDIGTGSGIISCMIGILSKKAGYKVEILGTDISLNSLNVAIDNMKKNNLTRTVMFRKSDIFSNIHKDEKFDIIISNPPYIPKKMKESIQKEVTFEPEIALFTNDTDGLYFYKKIIEQAPEFLNEGGYVFFEVMEGQAPSVKNLFEKSCFVNVNIIKDMSGIERVVFANLS